MFIRKIIFKNYRIYKGYNEICFEKDNNKNVFIITGNNGFGKTTFLTSLVWCLYGRKMVDVDVTYKQNVNDSGGYKNYVASNFNRTAKREAEAYHYRNLNGQPFTIDIELEQNIKKDLSELYEPFTYSVSMVIDDLSIPSVPCNNVTITRGYNTLTKKENIEVLIDGVSNELTNELGPEIFINDFILPKEVAKFFFFDAEAIVSLAELKSIDEKRNLSIAYTEVLGIKKFEDLKNNLENLRIRFRRKSATLDEQDKFTTLQKELNELEKFIHLKKEKLAITDEEIKNKRLLASQFQEKLIREGNTITLEELNALIRLKDKLQEEGHTIRAKLKESLEIVPFAVASNLLTQTYNQLIREKENADHSLNSVQLRNKLTDIHQSVIKLSRDIVLDFKQKELLVEKINKVFNFETPGKKTDASNIKILLGFDNNEIHEFRALYENIKFSFSHLFQTVVKEERNNRIFLNKTLKKIALAESNEKDLLIKEIRQDKSKVERQILDLEKENRKLLEELGGYQKEFTTKSKVVAELSKKVSLNDYDKRKDSVAERLVERLNRLLVTLKSRKKESLELRIKHELNNLLHKTEFINRVEVTISDDYLDIHLFDNNNNILEKESLSKGEQQLYASSILKALVDESEIEFPIFIDSPLQKLDKKHAKNVICEFYPSISSQVVILPLLEKELAENEYNDLLPNVNQVFLIKNHGNQSYFESIAPANLFSQLLETN